VSAKYIKRREQFEKEARDLLRRLGAVEPQENPYPWPIFNLATKAGNLRLSFHTRLWCARETWFRADHDSPWIAGRFDDVEAARKLVDSNPYSGKWNHHYWRGWTSDFYRGLRLLESELKKIYESTQTTDASTEGH
jgi:hypothetical protein